jgi:hypothetical protein
MAHPGEADHALGKWLWLKAVRLLAVRAVIQAGGAHPPPVGKR